MVQSVDIFTVVMIPEVDNTENCSGQHRYIAFCTAVWGIMCYMNSIYLTSFLSKHRHWLVICRSTAASRIKATVKVKNIQYICLASISPKTLICIKGINNCDTKKKKTSGWGDQTKHAWDADVTLTLYFYLIIIVVYFYSISEPSSKKARSVTVPPPHHHHIEGLKDLYFYIFPFVYSSAVAGFILVKVMVDPQPVPGTMKRLRQMQWKFHKQSET